MPACLKQHCNTLLTYNARVAELVDALDLGSSAAGRESSSLSFRTKYIKAFLNRKAFFMPIAFCRHEKSAALICLQKPNML